MKNRMNTRKARAGLVLVGLALIATACGERPLSTMDPESPIARDLDTILVWLLIAAGVVFVLVQGAVLYMARRFRVPAPDDPDAVYGDDEFPEQTHGNTSLEIGWTIVPTLIMAVVAFFTLGLLFDLEDVRGADDPDREIQKIVVVGHQWWWEFQYHTDNDGVADIVTAGDLVLPVGEEVALEVTSRDVIHSFWVPALNGKRDAVPGRTNTWTIEAGTAGRFPGECTEFCGLSHAYMEKWAVGLEKADWQEWAANQRLDAVAPTDEDALKGWEIFQNNQCASCHIINGLTKIGDGETPDSYSIYDGANRLLPKDTLVAGAAPNLTHLATRSSFAGGIFDLYKNPDGTAYNDLSTDAVLNRGHLEAWLRNAGEQKANDADNKRGMPAFESLSGEDIDHLVTFLMTLD